MCNSDTSFWCRCIAFIACFQLNDLDYCYLKTRKLVHCWCPSMEMIEWRFNIVYRNWNCQQFFLLSLSSLNMMYVHIPAACCIMDCSGNEDSSLSSWSATLPWRIHDAAYSPLIDSMINKLAQNWVTPHRVPLNVPACPPTGNNHIDLSCTVRSCMVFVCCCDYFCGWHNWIMRLWCIWNGTMPAQHVRTCVLYVCLRWRAFCCYVIRYEFLGLNI